MLTKYLGWEWIFFVNVPVGVLAFLLAPRFVRESRSERETSPDVAGAVTVTAGLALLVYAISQAPDHGWSSALDDRRGSSPRPCCSSAFLVIEARAKHPLMPFSIFRVRTVAGANVVGLLLGAVTFANFFVLTLYVQQVLGYSALKTGVTFVGHGRERRALGGRRAGARRRRSAPKPVMAVGFVAMIARDALVHADPGATASFATDLLPGYLLVGFALPFTFIPVSIAALAGVAGSTRRASPRA